MDSIKLLGNISSIKTLRNKTIRISIDLNEQTTHDNEQMNKLWEVYNTDSELELVGFAIDGKTFAVVESHRKEELSH